MKPVVSVWLNACEESPLLCVTELVLVIDWLVWLCREEIVTIGIVSRSDVLSDMMLWDVEVECENPPPETVRLAVVEFGGNVGLLLSDPTRVRDE